MTSSERPALRERLKWSLYRLFEGLWGAGFALAGRLCPLQVPRYEPAGGQRVLVIAPHPDDETIGCGGTILRHCQGGDRVWVLVATDGRQSRAGRLSAPQMAARRREEAAAATRLLGVTGLIWAGLPEGAWQPAELQEILLRQLAEIRPDLLYTPSRIDFHPEHRRVAEVTADALAQYRPATPLLVRIYPIQVPLTSLLADVVCDTSAVTATVTRALNTYETQAANLQRAQRRHRYTARRYGINGTAEEFWELTPEEYVALHRLPPAGGSEPFRGLRARPFSDPLAYLSGRAARRAYRSAVAHKFSRNSK